MASIQQTTGVAFQADVKECLFCHGRPVGNAAKWWDPDAAKYAACPRCGETNLPKPPRKPSAAVKRTKLVCPNGHAMDDGYTECPACGAYRPPRSIR